MAKEVKRSELVFLQAKKDDRCIDMLLTLREIEKAIARAEDPKNSDLIPHDCCTCWPIEKPPKCKFWDRIMFNCPNDKE
jgi:hypothetical protein